MEWKVHMLKITLFSLFFWINSVSGMVRAEIWNLVGKPLSLRSTFENWVQFSSVNWFWFEWVPSLWKSYSVQIQVSFLAHWRKNHSGCDFGVTWNIGRLWCRRQSYIEILSGHAQRIQESALVYCAEDKTRSVYSAEFCSAQKCCWAGEKQWTWVQDQDLALLHTPPVLQEPLQPQRWDGSRSLGTSLHWIWKPLVLDKYRFVPPAFAQTSSSLAHRQTELLCTQLAAVYCCSAQAIWCGFQILSRQTSGLCMAYTLWEVLLLTVCAYF